MNAKEAITTIFVCVVLLPFAMKSFNSAAEQIDNQRLERKLDKARRLIAQHENPNN